MGRRSRAAEITMSHTPKARGTLPDADGPETILVIKMVPVLHLTYQLKLLNFMARRTKRTLIVRIPEDGYVSEHLSRYMRGSDNRMGIERTLPRITS